MRWFGLGPPFSYACIDTPHAATPTDASCAWCEEPIASSDYGYLIPHVDGVHNPDAPTSEIDVRELAYHGECWQRQLIGSVGHIEQRCSCYGGTEEDPPGLSKRDAATAAVKAFAAKRPPQEPHEDAAKNEEGG